MKRQIKTVVAITTLAITTSASISVEACDRGGRRTSYSQSRYSAPVSQYRHYAPPVYHQPQVVYRQPVQSYPPPQIANQRLQQAPGQLRPQGQPQQFQGQSQAQFQGQPQSQQFQGQAQAQRQPQQFQGQAQAQRQPQQFQGQSQAQPQQFQGQTQQAQRPAQNSVQNRVQPAAQNRAQPQQLAARPNNTQQRVAPATQQANVPQQAAAPQQNVSQVSAESSALQMLASINMAAADTSTTPVPSNNTSTASSSQIPDFGPPANAANVAGHVGTWSVTLPGSQSVELVLEGDGNFTWTATKNNASNNFKGQYRMEKGRLTLVRSTDLQQMAGSWTGRDQGFTFKLDGATSGGLAFSRG
jgi:hypothetical protein